MTTRRRKPKYVMGNALFACSVCGRTCLYPDELSKANDGTFRCHRFCLEETLTSVQREQAVAKRRKDDSNPKIGAPRVNWPENL